MEDPVGASPHQVENCVSRLTGVANAVDGAVTVVRTKMNRILEIDEGNRLAVVQPGVVNRVFHTEVESRGLFYAPDPSSCDWCTIGGNLSINAGGLCCVKYGVTTDAVLGLEVVLASGDVLRTGKGVAGYDLTKLIVGSEGTLGIITEMNSWSGCVWMPAPPSATSPTISRRVACCCRPGGWC